MSVVDLRAAIQNAPEAQRDEARAALEQFGALGDVGFPIDVWITDGGLPARMVMTFTPPDGDGDMSELVGEFDLRMQIDLFDFGAPVDIDPPDPSEVRAIDDPAEIEELFGGMGGAAGIGELELDYELESP